MNVLSTEKQQAIRTLFAEGKTYAAIAKEVGCSRATILRYTKDAPARRSTKGKPRGPRNSPAETAEVTS